MSSTADKSESSSELAGSVPDKLFGVARLIAATKYSKQGIQSAFRSEEAFRLECVATVVLVPAAVWIGDTAIEKALLICTLFIVLITELLNSAIETVVDRIGSDYNELSGQAKDMGSAAVFFSLLLVIITWVILLV